MFLTDSFKEGISIVTSAALNSHSSLCLWGFTEGLLTEVLFPPGVVKLEFSEVCCNKSTHFCSICLGLYIWGSISIKQMNYSAYQHPQISVRFYWSHFIEKILIPACLLTKNPSSSIWPTRFSLKRLVIKRFCVTFRESRRPVQTESLCTASWSNPSSASLSSFCCCRWDTMDHIKLKLCV